MNNLIEFFKNKNFPSLMRSSVLQSRNELDDYNATVNDLGLEGHHDFQKNWDTLKAFLNIVFKIDKSENILDAGSSGNSAILRWLSLIGYSNLFACDVREKNKKYLSSDVLFSIQDITSTNYESNSFSAITCISVIEHGVDFINFFKEMSRLIKPGGQLLVSTDFWNTPIDTHGIYPYGKNFGEMKVMNIQDINNIISIASDAGFIIDNKFPLSASEKVVRWERVNREYTFIFLVFTKL